MANSIMNTIYNQYLTTYAPKKSDTRYDTHKRSELRNIYNSMAKINRDAPFYKFDNDETARQTVVGIKEEARQLHNSIVSIMGTQDSTDFNSKVAYSSNENIVSAKYIGGNVPESLTNSSEEPESQTADNINGSIPSYDIEVTSLASPQVNLGKYLPKDGIAMTPDDYSFDLTVNGQGYEFHFSIRENETNFDVQNRLSRLINNSGIHLTSSVEEDANGNSALKIASSQIGVGFGQNSQVFSISDNKTSQTAGSVDYFGIDYTAREASNAHIKVNGMEASSSSNSFILEKNYEITLNGISPNEGETTTIGLKPDTEALVDHISHLVGSYNQFIKSISEYQATQTNSLNLVNEMNGIVNLYQQEMGNIGIVTNEEGTLSLDKDTLSNAALSGEAERSLSSVQDFSKAMLRKSSQVSLNPVSYIDKTVVAYKNPGKTLLTPYVASAYAGMLFNSYC